MARTIIQLVMAVFAFGCLGLFGILFIAVGFQDRARSNDNRRRFRAPKTMTLAQLTANPPTEGWLRIKEGTLSALDTTYIEIARGRALEYLKRDRRWTDSMVRIR